MEVNWTALVARTKTDEVFKQEVLAARSLFLKLEKERAKRSLEKPFVEESLDLVTANNLRVEKALWFVPSTTFTKQHGLTPQAAGLTVENLHDERGQMVEGFFMADADSGKLKVIASHNVSLEQAKTILAKQDCVRPGQGAIFRDMMSERLEKRRPRTLVLGSPPSVEDVDAMIESGLAKQALAARDVPPPAPEPAPLQEARPEPARQVERRVQAPLWKELQDDVKVKGKGKGREKGKKPNVPPKEKLRAASTCADSSTLPSPATVPALSSSPAALAATYESIATPCKRQWQCKSEAEGSEASSGAGAKRVKKEPSSSSQSGGRSSKGKGKNSEKESTETQAKKWLAELSIVKALEGRKCGNELYQSYRIILSDPNNCSDLMTKLKLQYHLVEAAEKLCAEFDQLDSEELAKKCAEILPEVEKVPTNFALKLLFHAAKGAGRRH